jgi:hypothetical protein
VPFTIKKRDWILSKVKAPYFRKLQKFGIELPKTIKRAYEIDAETGTTFWHDVLQKEIGVILAAVKVLESDDNAPVGFQEIPCHVVFDIKMYFSCKARFVTGGHVTETPEVQIYASVVSHDSVGIALLIEALHDVSVVSADVQGASLNAPCLEKVYTICGPEFGPELLEQIEVIVKALYGLKLSAFAWRTVLAETLRNDLGFEFCKADNDVWY